MASLVLALAKAALHVGLAHRWGYADEELYILACSERLDWGYHAAAPLVVYLTLAGRIVLGSSLLGVRVLPALAGGVLVLATAVLARRLGGDRFAAGLAAATVALAPPLMSAHAALGEASWAPLTWTVFACYVVGRERRSERLPAMTLAAGIVVGVLAAPTMAPYAAGILAALVLAGRGPAPRLLLTTLLCAAALAPFLYWQAEHGWPLADALRGAPAAAEQRVFEVVAATHVATAPLWLAGVLGLVLAPRLAPGRVLGLALFPLLGVFVWQVWEPRPLLPVFPLLVAAGAVVVASLTRLGGRRWLRVAVGAAVVVPLVATAPLRLPLLEPSAVPGYAAVMAPLASWPQAAATELPVPAALSRMLGWREQAKAARRAFELLPRTERERAVVWARSRYQAAAMDRLGERYGLPRALSGDGDYRRWSDGAGDADPVVTIGFTTAELQPWFRSVREGAVANCDLCVPERQRVSVHLCGDARLPTDKLRDEMARAGP